MATPDKTLDVLIRLRTETDKAIKDLDKSTKAVKDLESAGKKSAPSFAGVISGLKGLAAAAAGLFGVQQVIRFITSALREFAEGEVEAAKLAATLRVMGGNAEALAPVMGGLRNELKAFNVSGTDTDKGLNRLLLTFGDFELAMKASRLAAQLSAAAAISYNEAIGEVTGALQGNIRSGSVFGRILKSQRSELESASNESERLNIILANQDKLAAAAAGQVGTLASETKSLAIAWVEFKEELGKAINALVDLPTVIDTVKNAILGLRAVLGLLSPEQKAQLRIAELDQQILAKKQQMEELGTVLGRVGTANLAAQQRLRDEAYDAVANTVPDLLDGKIVQRLLRNGFLAQRAITGTFSEFLSEVTKSKDTVAFELAQLEQERGTLERVYRTERKIETARAKKESDNLEIETEQRKLEEFRKMRERFLADALAAESVATAQAAQKDMDRQLALLAREKEIDLRLVAGNLDEQLRLVREYADKEAAIRAKGAAAVSDGFVKAADAARAQVDKLTEAPIEAVAKIAVDGGTFSDVLKLEEDIGKVTVRNADALARMQKAFELWRDALKAARQATEDLDVDGQFRLSAEIADRLREAAALVQSDLSGKVTTIEARVKVGALSGQQGIADVLAARQAAAAELQGVQREQLEELARLGDTPASAAARQQLLRDIREVNAALSGLAPTFEEQARASDNFWEGLSIGARQASADAQTFGQLGSDVTKTFEEGIASGGAQLFDNLVTGAKNFGETMRQVFSDLLRQIAQLIIQTLIFRAISSALGGIGGATSTASSQVATQTGGGLSRNIVLSGGIRMAEGGVIDVGTGPTADDVPILASKGEGIVNAKAVSAYGAPVIHALNRLAIPRNVFAGLTMPSMPQVPQLRFAQGGVVGDAVRSQASGDRSQAPLVLNNVVAIGDSEAKRLFASSAFKDAVRSEITQNAGHIERTVRGKRGFRDD